MIPRCRSINANGETRLQERFVCDWAKTATGGGGAKHLFISTKTDCEMRADIVIHNVSLYLREENFVLDL